MKRIVATGIAVILLSLMLIVSPAQAFSFANGATVFSANCAACHVGGGNLVNPAKTLKQDALEKYGMASLDAITTQIMNGKGGMPAFKARLTPEQIEDVAHYVLERATKGWS